MRCPCGCHRGDICRPMSGAVSVVLKPDAEIITVVAPETDA